MTPPLKPRETYIKIATSKFAEFGYRGASLDAIAKEAGVTKQALLHFFGTKKKLYEAVLEDHAADLSAHLEATEAPSPQERLLLHAQFLTASQGNRLIIRALMDSQDTADHWPMKSYLDALLSFLQMHAKVPRSSASHLSWINKLIGLIQYHIISLPAMIGMYGPDCAQSLEQEFEQTLRDEIDAILR